jgi:hypothetical protein
MFPSNFSSCRNARKLSPAPRAGGRLDSLDVALDVFPSRDGNQLLRYSKRIKTRVPHPFIRERVGLSALAFVEFLCINKKNLAVSVGHPPTRQGVHTVSWSPLEEEFFTLSVGRVSPVSRSHKKSHPHRMAFQSI